MDSLNTKMFLTVILLSLGMIQSVFAKSIMDDRLFILLGTGGSFSNKANISASPAFWDPAVQGYNATVGNTALYTAGMGFQFSPLITGDIEVTRRPSFSYSKFQIPAVGSSSTPGFLGTKTRTFDLDNTSIMANFILNGCGFNLGTRVTHNSFLQPFLGGGMGVAYNTVSNFHSILPTGSVSSIMNSKTRASFAWQFLVGAEWLQAQTWGLDLGYRYFNGGTFTSNNYLINSPTFSVKPWTGTLSANEVFFSLKYFVA